MFDALVREVASRFDFGGKAGSLLNAVLTWVFKEEYGGLNGVVERFRKAGLGDLVSSWIGSSSPRELTTSQLGTALGDSLLEQLADKAGLTLSKAKPALAFLLPKLIGLVTADGKIPTGTPAAVSSWLSGLHTPPRTEPAYRAEPSYRAEPARTFAGPGFWKWLVPLLALGALGLWFLWPVSRALPPTDAPSPATRVTGTGDVLPAKIYFTSASTTLGAEDTTRIGRVADYLKATPGAVVDITGFADRTGGAEVNEEIAKERAKAVRAALLAAGISEAQAVLAPPASVTGSGSEAEARRVEVRLRP